MQPQKLPTITRAEFQFAEIAAQAGFEGKTPMPSHLVASSDIDAAAIAGMRTFTDPMKALSWVWRWGHVLKVAYRSKRIIGGFRPCGVSVPLIDAICSLDCSPTLDDAKLEEALLIRLAEVVKEWRK